MKTEKLKSKAGIVTVFMIALMMAVMISASDSVWASEGSVSIYSASEVSKGETFTVTVDYAGDNLGRVRGMMKYDTAVLKYLSGGSSKGNGGAVELRKVGEGGNITFIVKFKAVGNGNSRLSLKTSDMYDLDEMDMGNPTASAAVTVNAPASEEVPQNEGQSDGSNEEAGEKDEAKADDQDQEEPEVIAPAPDEQDSADQTIDEDEDTDENKDRVSDRTKIIAIIIAAAVSILAVNLIILRARKKKR